MTIGSRPHKARKPAARALKSPPSLRGRIPVASRAALSASLSDLRGVGQLAVAAVIGTTQLVEEMHARIVRAVPVVGKPTASALLSIPTLAYRSVRGVTRLVGAAVDTVLACAESRSGSPATASSAERDAALAVLNGVLGDYLADTDNPLALPMRLRTNGQPLRLDRRALASAFTSGNRKLLVAVHGLCMTDTELNRQAHNHADELALDLGYTPISLQYNTGRRISTNGREFAGMMERLASVWPVPLDEVVIIGHSMGGLVARSACHYAKRERHRWLGALSKMVFLGTPHHGAPLERAGNWLEILLNVSPYTVPLARLGGIRSAGIKDLRHGNLVDEDWQGRRDHAPRDARTPVPLPAGVQCFTLAASRSANAARLAGDGLVPVKSALGQHDDPSFDLGIPEHRRFTLHGLNHFELRTSREVYQRLYRWLSLQGDRLRALPHS
jgi:pimeloyl-ACP methyl ester carboxylesterase